MNNNYLNSDQFLNAANIKADKNILPINQEYIPIEKSYIENILRLNKGKKISVYQSFPNNNEWKNEAFSGILEQCGRDHIILSDPTTGSWYLLLMPYIDFIKFDEEINTVEQFYSITK